MRKEDMLPFASVRRFEARAPYILFGRLLIVAGIRLGSTCKHRQSQNANQEPALDEDFLVFSRLASRETAHILISRRRNNTLSLPVPLFIIPVSRIFPLNPKTRVSLCHRR